MSSRSPSIITSSAYHKKIAPALRDIGEWLKVWSNVLLFARIAKKGNAPY